MMILRDVNGFGAAVADMPDDVIVPHVCSGGNYTCPATNPPDPAYKPQPGNSINPVCLPAFKGDISLHASQWRGPDPNEKCTRDCPSGYVFAGGHDVESHVCSLPSAIQPKTACPKEQDWSVSVQNGHRKWVCAAKPKTQGVDIDARDRECALRWHMAGLGIGLTPAAGIGYLVGSFIGRPEEGAAIGLSSFALLQLIGASGVLKNALGTRTWNLGGYARYENMAEIGVPAALLAVWALARGKKVKSTPNRRRRRSR